MNKLTITIFTVLISFTTYCQETNRAILDSLIGIAYDHFHQHNCHENIPFLSNMLKKSTDEIYIHRLSGLLMDCYLETGQYDKLFALAGHGHEHGVVYRFPGFYKEALVNFPEWDKMVAANDSVLQIQKKKAKAKYNVVLPENYDNKKKYPLFIVLTKGYRTHRVLLDSYRSDRIKENYILVFMHSSDFRKTGFYEWPHDDVKYKYEIEELFSDIKSKYSIDTTNIIIGGMSTTGRMAIEMAFRGNIPVKGFITFCTVMNELSQKEITGAIANGIKGVLVAGMNDKKFLEHSQIMYQLLKKNDFQVLYESGDFGHQIPKDSYQYIDNAIGFMLE